MAEASIIASRMATLHVLRVFTGDGGSGGNPLGVFLDGAAVPEQRRQAVAQRLGFAETVFVDDAERGALRIFTPGVELPFAGHPLVGSAWLLHREGFAADMLRPPAGEVSVRREDGGQVTWIAGRPEWAPDFDFVELPSPFDVEALTGPPEGHGAVSMWSWLDEAAGVLRARVFVPAVGVPEDEATGAAAVRMGALLGRPITIRQGVNSILQAHPLPDGRVEVGGGVALVETRDDPAA